LRTLLTAIEKGDTPQAEICKKAGVTARTVIDWRRGRSPALYLVEAVANAAGFDLKFVKKGDKDEAAVLKDALTRSMTALDDWLNLYAPDECNPDRVAEAKSRVWPGGTIGYIAEVQAQNRAAMNGASE